MLSASFQKSAGRGDLSQLVLVLAAVLEVAFEYQHGGYGIHHVFAVFAADIGFIEYAVRGYGSRALVPKLHGQAR